MAEPTFDHERLDVYRLSIDYVARGSVLECAAIHDVLRVCDAMDDESNVRGKSDLIRIVSMLTRLIQRTQTVSEDRTEYEYEYRDAEYEYEGHRAAKT
jgi:hypothetical protein